ncbi:MAG: hypothetical protein H0W14_03390, partial [Actinobacteria bacterium]|nr:hypothetical protein [Actinomycetota bacterium]
MTRPRRAGLGVILAAALLVLAWPAAANAQATITTAGALTQITITPDLNCDVRHISDTSPEFFGSTACGTLVATGGTLFGPASIPAGGSASPRTAFTPVSQTGPLGSGTAGDPFRIITVVGLPGTSLTLTETDSYVAGTESYRTDVTVSNAGGGSSGIVYRAGDCFLQESDSGFGSVNPAAGSVACVGVTPAGTPSSRIEQWDPLTPGSSYFHANYDEVWARIGAQLPFPNTCRC